MLNLPLSSAALVPIAARAGFVFHHCDEDDLTMTRRLIEHAFVPHATHFVGVGGVVLNDRRELLVVCEATGRSASATTSSRGRPAAGRAPGGRRPARGAGETGVQARFEALVCFATGTATATASLTSTSSAAPLPLSEDVTMQAEEIEECLWMPVEEYFASDLVSVFNKRIVRAALASPGRAAKGIEGYADPARYEFFMPDETQE